MTAVDAYGGSSVLIKLMNRLGLCSSETKLRKFIQHIVTEREKIGPERELDMNSLIVLSVDNIDFLVTFARNYFGSKDSNWHGTTLHAVQPKPQVPLAIDPDSHSHKPGDKRGKLSPYQSPLKTCRSPAPKITKARQQLEGTASREQSTDFMEHQFTSMPLSTNISKPTLENFRVSSSEHLKMEDLEGDPLSYCLLSHNHKKVNKESSTYFVTLQEYLSLTKVVEVEQSKIVYMKVLDAIADQKDTLIHILHDLHKKFIEEMRLEHVLVEGDAKN